MDDLKGEVADEKLHERTLGNDILAADLDGENYIFILKANEILI